MHLGIAKAPCRSTPSYANEHRPATLLEEPFWNRFGQVSRAAGTGELKHKFRFKNKPLK